MGSLGQYGIKFVPHVAVIEPIITAMWGMETLHHGDMGDMGHEEQGGLLLSAWALHRQACTRLLLSGPDSVPVGPYRDAASACSIHQPEGLSAPIEVLLVHVPYISQRGCQPLSRCC